MRLFWAKMFPWKQENPSEVAALWMFSRVAGACPAHRLAVVLLKQASFDVIQERWTTDLPCSLPARWKHGNRKEPRCFCLLSLNTHRHKAAVTWPNVSRSSGGTVSTALLTMTRREAPGSGCLNPGRGEDGGHPLGHRHKSLFEA